ncbi:MAG: transcription antitermination factor NusB [Planctomycetota bacterium]
MKGRSASRECAFRLLFEAALRGPEALDGLESTLRDQLEDEESRHFCQTLIEGVRARDSELGTLITQLSHNWDIKRLPTTDRIVILMGLHEMTSPAPVPPAVAIDEAVELAKRYGGADSPGFVNAILDAHRRKASAGA